MGADDHIELNDDLGSSLELNADGTVIELVYRMGPVTIEGPGGGGLLVPVPWDSETTFTVGQVVVANIGGFPEILAWYLAVAESTDVWPDGSPDYWVQIAGPPLAGGDQGQVQFHDNGYSTGHQRFTFDGSSLYIGTGSDEQVSVSHHGSYAFAGSGAEWWSPGWGKQLFRFNTNDGRFYFGPGTDDDPIVMLLRHQGFGDGDDPDKAIGLGGYMADDGARFALLVGPAGRLGLLRIDGSVDWQTEGTVLGTDADDLPAWVTPSGGGAVDSVNGETGVVVLDAADVGADPAGTAAGLVDDLSGVSNQSTARTNLGLGTAATTDTGTGSANTILGNDARLTDARTPTTHNHAGSDITSGTVGTARLGSGSASSATFLRGDQTWATVSVPNRLPFAANDYLDLSERHGTGYAVVSPSSNATNSNNTAIYVPFHIGATISVDQLAVVCGTANNGGSAVVRLGIHATSSGRPGSVVVDAGTSSINATGLKSLGFTAVQLTPGWYFAVLVAQGLNTGGANPAFSSVSSAKQGGPMTTPGSSNDIGAYISASVSGALSANPSVSFNRASSTLPAYRINMRVSTP